MAVGRVLRAVGGRRIPRWVWWLVSAKLAVVVFLVVLVAVVGMFGGGGANAFSQQRPAQAAPTGAVGDGTWAAGNIIADSVFYNSRTMTAGQIQAFLGTHGCTAPGCLGQATYTWPGASVAWCQPVAAGSGSFAVMLSTVSTACGLNPQVGLVMIAKESQGLTRNPPPAALTGFDCPDTGAGGSANCGGSTGGVWNQTWGMAQGLARLRTDASRVNYLEGQTHNILWNVAESGCGSGPVLVANRATASLYTYTPYQPNAASLATYPGTGDKCSSYGNRNFYRLFTQWFGSTGGGKPTGGGGPVDSPPGLQRSTSQDPASFGWVHAGPMEPLVFRGHTFGQVALGTAKLWTALLTELVPLIPGGLTSDLGCFQDRANVNNPSVLSFHAYGLACDLNSADNPNGANPQSLQGRQFALPMATHYIAAKYGMEWGGDWTSGTPDPMHIEVAVTPHQVAAWSATKP